MGRYYAAGFIKTAARTGLWLNLAHKVLPKVTPTIGRRYGQGAQNAVTAVSNNAGHVLKARNTLLPAAAATPLIANSAISDQ